MTESNKPLAFPNPGKLGGNVLSLGGGVIIARVIAFLGTTYAARVLGPEHFGIVGFAMAIFGYLSLAVTGGFTDIGSREVARRTDESSTIAVSVITVRLVIALVAGFAVIFIAWSLNRPPTVKLVLLLTGLLLLPLALDVSWVFKGLERNRIVAISLIASQVLYTGLIYITVKEPEGVAFVPIAQFVGEFCAAIILLVPILRLGKIRLDLRLGFKILKASSYWAVSRLLRTLMYTFDVIMIGFLIGERAVGHYNAPYRICFLLVALSVAIQSSFLPIMTRAYRSDDPLPDVAKIAKHSVYFAAAIGAPLVVGGVVIAAPLLEAVFGDPYKPGTNAFRLLLCSIGFLFLHGTIHNIFLTISRLKTEMKIFAVAAAVNVAFNIYVIPRYGISGAASVTAIAEAVTLFIGVITVRRLGVSIDIRSIWKPVLASVMMAAALYALGSNQSLLLYLATGGAVYFLFLVLMRGIPPEIYQFLFVRTT